METKRGRGRPRGSLGKRKLRELKRKEKEDKRVVGEIVAKVEDNLEGEKFEEVVTAEVPAE